MTYVIVNKFTGKNYGRVIADTRTKARNKFKKENPKIDMDSCYVFPNNEFAPTLPKK